MTKQKLLSSAAVFATCVALASTAIANTNGPVEPHPDYPECLRYPVLSSKGEVLYWNFKGFCQAAACAADPRDTGC